MKRTTDRARELFDTYTRDVSRADLERLFTHDTRDAYRFFTRGQGEDRFAGLPWWHQAPLRVGDIEICGLTRPANTVGGDFYDVLTLGDGPVTCSRRSKDTRRTRGSPTTSPS